MMSKRAVFAVLLLLFSALALCGCGGGEPSAPSAGAVVSPSVPLPEAPSPSALPGPSPEPEIPAGEAPAERPVVTSGEYRFQSVVFHPAEDCETLSEFGYDYELSVLITRLRDGTVLLYRPVPPEVWKGLDAAEDPETYLAEHVAGAYECAEYLE